MLACAVAALKTVEEMNAAPADFREEELNDLIFAGVSDACKDACTAKCANVGWYKKWWCKHKCVGNCH